MNYNNKQLKYKILPTLFEDIVEILNYRPDHPRAEETRTLIKFFSRQETMKLYWPEHTPKVVRKAKHISMCLQWWDSSSSRTCCCQITYSASIHVTANNRNLIYCISSSTKLSTSAFPWMRFKTITQVTARFADEYTTQKADFSDSWHDIISAIVLIKWQKGRIRHLKQK